MAEHQKLVGEPGSVLLARDLPPDPRALDAHALADFETLARERMHPAAALLGSRAACPWATAPVAVHALAHVAR